MDNNVVYERDLLYPTDSLNNPGCIHVEVLSPTKSGFMPILIENKTNHSPVENIHSIIRIMQTDIFDRIHIDIKTNTRLYIKANDDLKTQYGNKEYIEVVLNGDKTEFKGIDDL